MTIETRRRSQATPGIAAQDRLETRATRVLGIRYPIIQGGLARIARAELGLSAKVTTVTGQAVDGKVSYISALADEATRSFPIEIELPNKDGKVLSGITASAIVSLGTIPAHLLPQSVLTLNDNGELGVRAVKDGVVAFYAVEIVSDSRAGVWVTGLPPLVDVITMGQEYVVPGQQVNATNVTGTQDSVGTDAAAEGVQS